MTTGRLKNLRQAEAYQVKAKQVTDLEQRRSRGCQLALRIVLWPLIAIDRIYHKLLFVVSTSRTFDGVTLYSIENDSGFFEKANKALNILRSVDPRRYQRVQRYMPILAHVRQGGDFYKHSARAFYVQSKPDDPAFFASMIVHEATHAYLINKGFRYEKSVREQHERICAREQLAFIVKAINVQEHVPTSQKEEVIRQWKTWFEEQLASGWWHDKNTRRNQMKALREVLGELFRK